VRNWFAMAGLLTITVGLGLLVGCDVDEQRARARVGNLTTVQRLMGDSVVTCADGNQIRTLVYDFGGNSTAFSSFTILNADGTPKRCVRRERAVETVEVPE
jgi:hypothetical protein